MSGSSFWGDVICSIIAGLYLLDFVMTLFGRRH